MKNEPVMFLEVGFGFFLASSSSSNKYKYLRHTTNIGVSQCAIVELDDVRILA
jgi:hypothetical protein